MTEAVPILNTTRLSILTPQQALENWNVIGGFLADGLRFALGRVSLDDIRKSVEDELGAIVIAWDPTESAVYSAFFCEIDRYPTGRTCWNVSLMGGRDIEEWKHLLDDLKAIARMHGCDQIEMTGRPGWGRVLGLREKARLYVEDL